ncbi:unnamed protein product [Amoebophrya sp. A25]|nr:unnamed protein product [Amoebophrya sp. A25]|eukprot:GSA25T00011027001.1
MAHSGRRGDGRRRPLDDEESPLLNPGGGYRGAPPGGDLQHDGSFRVAGGGGALRTQASLSRVSQSSRHSSDVNQNTMSLLRPCHQTSWFTGSQRGGGAPSRTALADIFNKAGIVPEICAEVFEEADEHSLPGTESEPEFLLGGPARRSGFQLGSEDDDAAKKDQHGRLDSEILQVDLESARSGGHGAAGSMRAAGYHDLQRAILEAEEVEKLATSVPEKKLSLEWRNLCFDVEGAGRILDNVYGKLCPGEVTALIGPSGAGKSTLLNLLAARQRWSGKGITITGEVRYGGKPVDDQILKQSISYVMQHEELVGSDSVLETFQFAAKLRLPDATPEERERNIEEMLHALDLYHVRDAPIGNALVKGISGGQKKRVAVGIELLTRPSIVFLDEPTSGLDSYSSMRLITMLKKIALEQNCIITATIHQPSSELFSKFDRVITMRYGEVLFQGMVGDRAQDVLENRFNTSAADGQQDNMAPGSSSPETTRKNQVAKLQIVSEFLEKIVDKPTPAGYNQCDWLMLLASGGLNDKELVEAKEQTARIYEMQNPGYGSKRTPLIAAFDLAGDVEKERTENLLRTIAEEQSNASTAGGGLASDYSPSREIHHSSDQRSSVATAAFPGISPGDAAASASLSSSASTIGLDRAASVARSFAGGAPSPNNRSSAVLVASPQQGSSRLQAQVSAAQEQQNLVSQETLAPPGGDALSREDSGEKFQAVPTLLHGNEWSEIKCNKAFGVSPNCLKIMHMKFEHTQEQEDATQLALHLIDVPPWCTQVCTLVRRNVRSKLRDPWGQIFNRLLVPVMQILIQGLAFLSCGRHLRTGLDSDGNPLNSPSAFNGKIGEVNNAVCNILFVTYIATGFAQITTLPQERPVFLREYTSNYYGVSAYLLAQLLSDLPLQLLTVLAVLIGPYFLFGLNGSIALYLLLNTVGAVSGAAMGIFMACLTPANATVPVMWAPLVLGTFPNALSGIFRPLSNVPGFLSWVAYVIPVAYTANVAQYLEFVNNSGGSQATFQPQNLTPEASKNFQDVRKEFAEPRMLQPWRVWAWPLVAFGLLFFFRLAGFALLKWNSRSVY